MRQEPTAADTTAKFDNFLKHLNNRHPDTVLFLARCIAGVPDALEALLLAVDADGIEVRVRDTQGSGSTRLRFTTSINTVT